jgi:hypothetical protein
MGGPVAMVGEPSGRRGGRDDACRCCLDHASYFEVRVFPALTTLPTNPNRLG